jgi:hypothetical protein
MPAHTCQHIHASTYIEPTETQQLTLQGYNLDHHNGEGYGNKAQGSPKNTRNIQRYNRTSNNSFQKTQKTQKVNIY